MKTILLDTNLLILLVIGAVNRRWIGRHKRAKVFVASDWHLLLRVIGHAPILTTPHILAETSNLLRGGGLSPDAHAKLMAGLARFIAQAEEVHMPARDVTGTEPYLRLGLTDAAILSMAEPEVHLLTVDLPLYVAAVRQGRPATNFNHCRDAAS